MISLADVLVDARYSLRQPRLRQLLIAALVLVAVTAVVAGAVWYPASSRIEALRRDVDEQRRETVNAVYAGQVSASYDAAAKLLPTLEQKLNLQFTQADLVTDLAKLANRHKLKLLSQSFEEGKAKNGYQPLRVDIGLQGRYTDVRNFLSGLHTLPSWMVVEQASLRRADGALVKAQMRLVTYRKLAEARR